MLCSHARARHSGVYPFETIHYGMAKLIPHALHALTIMASSLAVSRTD